MGVFTGFQAEAGSWLQRWNVTSPGQGGSESFKADRSFGSDLMAALLGSGPCPDQSMLQLSREELIETVHLIVASQQPAQLNLVFDFQQHQPCS